MHKLGNAINMGVTVGSTGTGVPTSTPPLPPTPTQRIGPGSFDPLGAPAPGAQAPTNDMPNVLNPEQTG